MPGGRPPSRAESRKPDGTRYKNTQVPGRGGVNLARPTSLKAIGKVDAQNLVLGYLADGMKVSDAMKLVYRTEGTYNAWMGHDKDFKNRVGAIRTAARERKAIKGPDKVVVPDFEEFCDKWLKQPLYPHQLRMLDVVEGREPRDLHPSMDYLQGYPQRVIINVPPEHAKTTTFSVNYSVWMIHKNPDIRIVIMSQGKTLAQRMLGEIKFKLMSPVYREMHMRFAPEGGWKDPDNSWTADAIYVEGKGGDKDPTVQALGLGGQIYGSRADVIWMDDTITTKNCRELDRQMILLEREIESRLPSDQEGGGLLCLIGTRVSPHDLYRTLMDVEDADGDRVWTYFRQPAVLDYGNGDSSDWHTLWPEKWNGKSLSRRRRGVAWNLIYQQLNVDDEMTFKVEAVDASINGLRFPGPMSGDGRGDRKGGMEGLYVIGGLDPATVGATAMIVVGLDKETGKRWVLDGFNKQNTLPETMRNKVKYLTETYHINEWVIESNAFQKFLTQDRDLTQFLRAQGCRLTPHTTSENKYDAEFGIQTMGPIFNSCGRPDEKLPSGQWRRNIHTALIDLPSMRQNPWVSELVQELTSWQPEGMSRRQKTDLVMALWFTHIACQRIMQRKSNNKSHHSYSPFLTPSAKGRQLVVDLAALRREKTLESVG